MSKFYCMYCGNSASTISNLTGSSCKKNHEGKKHVPYSGSSPEKCTCKYCGSSASTISNLTGSSCKNSPNKYHIPL
jgi:hypothetical protein